MKTTAHPKPRAKAASKTQRKKKALSPVEQALVLDGKESLLRWKAKRDAAKKQFGPGWRDKVRPGRVYTRVLRIEPTTAEDEVRYELRPEPGWEIRCGNCKTYSLVLPSMIAIWTVDNQEIRTDMMKEWEQLAQKTLAAGFKPPSKPTPEICPCPNCKFRPGAPE